MAESGAVSERKHGGEAAAFEAESRVANRVNPAMKAVETAGGRATGYARRAQARLA